MSVVFKNVRAVLFDLDGTLLDSSPDLAAAANKMRLDRGMLELESSSYRSMVGSGARGMLHVAFGIATSHVDFDAYKAEFFNNYESCLTRETAPFDGALDLIEQINLMGMKWAVVTNKAERFTLPIVAALPLFSTAATVISGDTTPYSKPHPAPLHEAAKRIGVSPGECIYVGDDERDIVAGRAAGMHTVAAAYGYLGQGADVEAWRADTIIFSLGDVLKLLPMP